METKYKHFRDHIFLYILVPLIIVVGVISYYRFIVNHNYVVGYEGVCDPATEKCFVGVDDTSGEEYYYSKVQKYAPDLYVQCGENITDCEAAYVCLPEDNKCSVTYCDTEVKGNTCSTPTEEPNTQSDDQVEATEEELLQSNNINNTNI